MSEKLVRDLIPFRVIADKGQTAVLRIADVAERKRLLIEKLMEEGKELGLVFADKVDEDKMTDLHEVLDAIAEYAGIKPEEITAIRESKAAERGKFACWYVMRFD